MDQKFDGMKYQVAYSEQTHRVSYVYTDDPKFRTTDGVMVGGSIPVSKDSLLVLTGWQIRGPVTADGWWPILSNDLPRIKLKDGTELVITNEEDLVGSRDAVIVGFAKSRLN